MPLDGYRAYLHKYLPGVFVQKRYMALRLGACLWCFMLTFAVAADWQWRAIGNLGNVGVGSWGHSVSYSVLSSSGASGPFPAVTNIGNISYGGFTFPYDRRVRRVRDDFDGDGKSDCWYFHIPSQVWYIILSSSATEEIILVAFGLPGAVPVLEDYDGDFLTDPAVYQESSGTWRVLLSSYGYASVSVIFGGPGYSPVPADDDGDRRADPVVYFQAGGNWAAMLSASGYNTWTLGGFGGPGYAALTGDFDMDDKSDPIIYNETLGALSIALSGSDYRPVSAGYAGLGWTMLSDDYDGDGCADVAAYGRESGLWYVINYKLEHVIWDLQWGGGAGYQPLAGDYDGDGLADAAVFYRDDRLRDASWILDQSTKGPKVICKEY